MIENVNVTGPNGESIVAEGIAHIKNTNTNKEYLCYTLNEVVANGMTLMYVGEVAEDNQGLMIDDDTWLAMQQTLLRLTQGVKLPEITFLPMNGSNIKVGQVRKIALDANKKQALKDSQLTSTIAAAQNVPSDTPAKETNTFFDAAAPTPETASAQEPAVVPNIFDQPLKPAFDATTTSAPAENPAPQPGVEHQAEPEKIVPEEVRIIEPTPEPASPEIINTTLKNEIMDMSVDAGPAIENKDIPHTEITDEEAMAALDTLIKYFAQKKDKNKGNSENQATIEPALEEPAISTDPVPESAIPDNALAQGIPTVAETLVTPAAPENQPGTYEESAISASKEPAKSLTLTPPGTPPSLVDQSEESVMPSAEALSLEQQKSAEEEVIPSVVPSSTEAYTAYASQEPPKAEEVIPQPAVEMPLNSPAPNSLPGAEAVGGMLTPNQLPSQSMTM